MNSLDAFDFAYQPSLDKKQVQTLAICHFAEHRENSLILGPPGVARSISLSVSVSRRSSTATACSSPRRRDDRQAHNRARGGRFEETLKLFTVPRLLVIDAIGYPIAPVRFSSSS